MPWKDAIHVRDLEVSCHIGVGPEERATAQILRVDIVMFPPNGLHGLADDLRQTVDYHAVCLAVQALASARQRCLVETLAEEILQLLRTDFAVHRASVTLKKFILPFTQWVGVTLVSEESSDNP